MDTRSTETVEPEEEMSRKKLKPNQDLNLINQELLDEIQDAYKQCGSLNKTAQKMDLSLMKVRKALITAGAYSNATSEEVGRLLERGFSVAEISTALKITPAAVYAYTPYKTTAYNLTKRGKSVTTVNADKTRRYRERQAAVDELKRCIECGHDWRGSSGSLWTCITLHANQKFTTNGRGNNHSGAVEFSYKIKVSSRTGEPTEELIISTRPDGKTITRSSVELALERYLSIQAECGYVKGPKAAGQIFGASYLYAAFIRWGVIRSSL